ncbi:histidine phosphatase family protein [Aquabacterium sp.]|uniref:histidine phosphatase family protein n=1 Tax=Aquabacterium sp. TaxID=1872578 RepID=UPI002B69B0D6|nr:histidine phosphatase family protein [Aquabacterium sp.]HSW09060.1 histidine phosphatase family protein [Aquabacterium sp.]
MTLLLIRHGETLLNAARVLQPADTPLSPRGLAQAEALAQRLAAQPLAGILASDLPRALQTAAALGRLTGLPISTSALLHERNYGELRGQAYDDLGFNPLTMVEAPPGGESQAMFSERCALAWAELLALQQRLGGPLAVVTHGLVLREWLQHPLQLPLGMALPARLSNASVTEAAATPPHAVDRVDCTVHLTGALRDDHHSLSGG